MAFLSRNTPDSRYTPSNVNAGTAETFPRWAIQAGGAPTANKVYVARITLAPKAYTTATVLCVAAATGVATSFAALYDASTLARVAVSADLSTIYNASVANTHIDLALAYTCTAAADFYFALSFGTPSTLTLARGNGLATDVGSLAPVIADRHNATVSSGAMPDPLILEGGVAGKVHYWVRYV